MRRRQLYGLRKQLEAKLKNMLTEPQKTHLLIAERASDPTEEAQAEMAVDVAVRVMNLDWEVRSAVEAALERMQTGDYGICESCGQPIDPKRLKAIPWVALCAPCQASGEAEANSTDVHKRVA